MATSESALPEPTVRLVKVRAMVVDSDEAQTRELLKSPGTPSVHLDSLSFPLAGRYSLGTRIGQGGMGDVFQARDLVLNRDVAVKLFREGCETQFRSEAQITARLQHPNIPPVHDLGTTPDGRPFLAMKLVAGQTLLTGLRNRPADRSDMPELIAAFGRVCQAVGFAHSLGIIHRDLKPANVMLGAFGEVQVMDWGLARDERATDAKSLPGSHSSALETRVGQAMGTPGYMAPEQARGESAGPPSDVFALGAMLLQILTGSLPFGSKDAAELVRRAAVGDLDEAFQILGQCPAPRELVALCSWCLTADWNNRPSHAGIVAEAVAKFQAQAEAELAAAPERRRRQAWQRALRIVAMLVFALVAVVSLREARRRADDTFAHERNTQAIDSLLGDAEEALRADDLDRASTALEAASQRTADGVDAARIDRLSRRFRDRNLLGELHAIDDLLLAWADSQAVGRPGQAHLAEALREFGLVPGVTPTAEAVRLLKDSAVADRLLLALDLWNLGQRPLGLLAILTAADPDTYRNSVRSAIANSDPAGIRHLAYRTDAEQQPARFAAVLGSLTNVPVERRREILRSAWSREPTSLPVLVSLGSSTPTSAERGNAERLRWLQAAVAAHPHYPVPWTKLGLALQSAGDLAGAIDCHRQAINVSSRYPWAHINLGVAIQAQGDLAKAAEAYREAIRLQPDNPQAHINLGQVLLLQGDKPAATDEYRQATRVAPTSSIAHYGLGVALQHQNDYAGARASYKEALRLDPKSRDAREALDNLHP